MKRILITYTVSGQNLIQNLRKTHKIEQLSSNEAIIDLKQCCAIAWDDHMFLLETKGVIDEKTGMARMPSKEEIIRTQRKNIKIVNRNTFTYIANTDDPAPWFVSKALPDIQIEYFTSYGNTNSQKYYLSNGHNVTEDGKVLYGKIENASESSLMVIPETPTMCRIRLPYNINTTKRGDIIVRTSDVIKNGNGTITINVIVPEVKVFEPGLREFKTIQSRIFCENATLALRMETI